MDNYKNNHSRSGSAPKHVALIVDDELSNRIILKSLLKKYGYDVIEADNGEKAVAMFHQQKPDIIFMDIMMPVMDGYTAVEEIRKTKTDLFIPIIFLTAMSDEQALAKCIEVGGDDFLTKPFSHVVLSAKIKAMKRIRELHGEVTRLYSQMQNDQETAEAVFNGAVIAENLPLDEIETLLQPAELFSGDVLLSAHAPSRDVHVMLGDFTGHGLAAALGALPASEVFRAMTAKGFSPHLILAGINKKLHNLLPTGMFFAVQFISINSSLEYVSVCNCGMPDILMLDGETGMIKHRFSSRGLPLGIAPDCDFAGQFERIAISKGDRFLLISDGVSEARDTDNNYFGQQRLEDVISGRRKDQSAIASIKQALGEFCKDALQDDDISLAEIPCTSSILPQIQTQNVRSKEASYDHTEINHHDRLQFSLTLEGPRLRMADPIPMVLNHLQEMEGVQNHRGNLFTLLTELYINALDHGVLALDSSLKHSIDGFSTYFTEREKRLENLTEGQVRIAIILKYTQSGGRIHITVEDSGRGFDCAPEKQSDTPDLAVNSGRGIFLLKELCESVIYHAPGNKVEVVYAWIND